MIIGVVSDTHNVDRNIVAMVVQDLKARGARYLVHCGDIEPEHLDAELFGDLSVIGALTKNQKFMSEFTFPPTGWCFTRPGVMENRIVNLGPIKIYVGHERSFEALTDPAKVIKFLQEINQVCDGVTLAFSGHTHFQFLIERDGMIWVNPGAVIDNGGDGYEFALVDLDKKEVIFSRFPLTPINTKPLTVGIVVDTGNISQRDEFFWRQLAGEFAERDARVIIWGGNHWPGDIGRPEFDGFEVHYHLLPDQDQNISTPDNWHLVTAERPVVDVCGHRFLLRYDWGLRVSEMSEYASLVEAKRLKEKYHEVDFVVCGLNRGALFGEGEEITIINPGSARDGRHFATICLPRREITFGSVRIVK